MANQIAAYFASYPREEAVAGVADHLQKFWDPRMRKQLLAYVVESGKGLDGLVTEAVASLR